MAGSDGQVLDGGGDYLKRTLKGEVTLEDASINLKKYRSALPALLRMPATEIDKMSYGGLIEKIDKKLKTYSDRDKIKIPEMTGTGD